MLKFRQDELLVRTTENERCLFADPLLLQHTAARYRCPLFRTSDATWLCHAADLGECPRASDPRVVYLANVDTVGE